MEEMMRSVIEIIRQHIKAENISALNDPDSDLALLGIDSLETVSLIFDLEATLVIEFPAVMMVPETFRSARTIAEALYVICEKADRA